MWSGGGGGGGGGGGQASAFSVKISPIGGDVDLHVFLSTQVFIFWVNWENYGYNVIRS